MAGGGMVASGPIKMYKGDVTTYVIIACIVAASGGALFGYGAQHILCCCA